MYPDFQNLKVTVSQTENLVHQSILVTWTGGKPTVGGSNFQGDFLQMMQCYGDANVGPNPENCEYGSSGLLPNQGIANPGIGSRTGALRAAGRWLALTNPPRTADGSVANSGCDTLEGTNPDHAAARCIRPTTTSRSYRSPIRRRRSTAASTEFYDRFNTNEVQEASTGTDGTGQQFFQTLTSTEAPGLGCGVLEANGQPRNCWLVIVPRGEFKPNGWEINTSLTTGAPNFLTDSPLGASNWAQRIQIHLGFDPLQPNCPIGSAKERETVGTQLIAHAVFSWQLALNQAANCKTLYGYATTPESTDTTQLADTSGSSAGLAFTTIPIGSEATRINGGGPPPDLPPLVYAPVATSAITFGFNVNLKSGFVSTPIKLTPRLLAKALTQSYKTDLPDFDWHRSGSGLGNEQSAEHRHRPGVPEAEPRAPSTGGLSVPLAPLLTEDHSAVNQQVWKWIDADAAARKWLERYAGRERHGRQSGVPDARTRQGRGSTRFRGPTRPAATTACWVRRLKRPCNARWTFCRTSITSTTRRAMSAAPTSRRPRPGIRYNCSRSGRIERLVATIGVQPAGGYFMWGVVDSASLANYGLVPADLCDADGTNCVSPDTATVSAALDQREGGQHRAAALDPANVGSDAYPLVDVTYAAVRANQDPAALVDFATLIAFAAGAGQTPGVLPGQLPHGYLPLTDKLKAQAAAGAIVLLALAAAQTSPSASPTTRTTTHPAGRPGPAVAEARPPPGTPNATVSPPGAALTPSASPGPESISQGPTTPAAKSTSSTPIGAVRWVLLTVMIVGLAGAIGAPRRSASRWGAGHESWPAGFVHGFFMFAWAEIPLSDVDQPVLRDCLSQHDKRGLLDR